MNLWDERFQHKRYAFGKEPNVFLTEAQNNHHIIEQNDNALAIAEGEGRNAVYLAELGANVTAWDFSIEGLRKAERLAFERGVHVETEHVDLNEASNCMHLRSFFSTFKIKDNCPCKESSKARRAFYF